MASTTADRDAVAALVDRFRQGFATIAAAPLQSIWDPDYDVIYSPLELETPLRGRAAIDRYYENIERLFAGARSMELTDVTIDVLGDVAFAFFRFDFVGVWRETGDPFPAEGHVTIVFRRVGDGWRGIHYHESPIRRP